MPAGMNSREEGRRRQKAKGKKKKEKVALLPSSFCLLPSAYGVT